MTLPPSQSRASSPYPPRVGAILAIAAAAVALFAPVAGGAYSPRPAGDGVQEAAAAAAHFTIF